MLPRCLHPLQSLHQRCRLLQAVGLVGCPDIQIQAVLTDPVLSIEPAGVTGLHWRRAEVIKGSVPVERQQAGSLEALRGGIRYPKPRSYCLGCSRHVHSSSEGVWRKLVEGGALEVKVIHGRLNAGRWRR
jgi:hypothetical protein